LRSAPLFHDGTVQSAATRNRQHLDKQIERISGSNNNNMDQFMMMMMMMQDRERHIPVSLL
jgi:hypothetical protein